jgi:hypothetical protein
MGEVVSINRAHPLVGTWRDPDEDLGTTVRFTVRPSGDAFEVEGIDAYDGEKLSISNVRWDGRRLSFDCLVPSNGRRVEYVFEVIAPSEVLVRYTVSERWIRVDLTT